MNNQLHAVKTEKVTFLGSGLVKYKMGNKEKIIVLDEEYSTDNGFEIDLLRELSYPEKDIKKELIIEQPKNNELDSIPEVNKVIDLSSLSFEELRIYAKEKEVAFRSDIKHDTLLKKVKNATNI